MHKETFGFFMIKDKVSQKETKAVKNKQRLTKENSGKGSNHDNVFRASMALPRVHKPFLQKYLPKVLAESLDYDSIKTEKATFVDDDLKVFIDDVVFNVKLADAQGYICLLLEHQSRADKLMPLRLLRYTVNALEYFANLHAEQDKPLPLIFPMVVYHSPNSKAYNHSTDIRDLINAPDELIQQFWAQPFHLLDLTTLSDEALLNEDAVGLLHYALKHSWERNPDYFVVLIKKLVAYRQLEPDGSYTSLSKIVLKYLVLTGNIDSGILFEILERADMSDDIKGDIMGRTAEQLIQKGVQQGIRQGMQQGIQQGVQEGADQTKKMMASNMLKSGVDIHQVAQWSGLPLHTVQELHQGCADKA